MAAKPRVHEIASELGIESKVALEKLKELGEFVKGPSSTIEPPVARKLRKAVEEAGLGAPKAEEKPAAKAPAKAAPKPAPKPAETVETVLFVFQRGFQFAETVLEFLGFLQSADRVNHPGTAFGLGEKRQHQCNGKQIFFHN